MLIVKIPFVGHGYNMPPAGTLLDPDPVEPLRSHLISIGVAAVYETKVTATPKEVKKRPKKPLGSAPVARASRKKTAKNSKKTAKK